MKPAEGRSRVVIEEITPQVDGGRHPARRTLGDTVAVAAAIFADGHDHVAARLYFRHASETTWNFVPMTETGNDMWTASFTPDGLGSWQFCIQGWIDHFDTWTSDLKKRLGAQPEPTKPAPGQTPQDIPLALRTGALLVEAAAQRAAASDSSGHDAIRLTETVTSLRALADENAPHYVFPLDDDTIALVEKYPDLIFSTRSDQDYVVWVDRELARFSSWYELFPRSQSPIPGQHGTLKDVEAKLPEVAAMGFDILYMPPIHPIGTAYRKGKNNSTTAAPGDHGSPWAIGAPEGGHTAIHPLLGTFDDFDHLVSAAHDNGLELALDIAFQCSPDHPWVAEHPDWFIIRPDGSIQYAENPPKKYQDIYPLNFESPDWRGLWDALYDVFEFWVARGVHVFRVDNPHTKALPFWEWVITTIHEDYPEVIFLAEAFTRPHVMYSLAKAGFTQSYTYFTWRTTKAELQTYLEEITRPPVSDFFQPNFWPNTPDILHAFLQNYGRPAFMQRVILAATLTANYGIYGPAYELGENTPAKPSPGKTESEEYMDSEKYEIRQREPNAPNSIAPLIARLNHIRRENKALQSNQSLHFHPVDNPNLLCYSKSTSDYANTILVAVNLDPTQEQAGWIDLDLGKLGIPYNQNFTVEDLLSGTSYTWHDRSNFVSLRPDVQPAHVFRIGRQG